MTAPAKPSATLIRVPVGNTSAVITVARPVVIFSREPVTLAKAPAELLN
jgi:hypothetical protein